MTKRSPNDFSDFEASVPLKLDTTFFGGGRVKSLCFEGFEAVLGKKKLRVVLKLN